MVTVTQTCWCGKKFNARSADVMRGWAKSCCKAHAAHAREKKLDRFGYRHSEQFVESSDFCNSHFEQDDLYDVEVGWDSHKDSY